MIPHVIAEWDCLQKKGTPTVDWILAVIDLFFLLGALLVNMAVMYHELRAWRRHEHLVTRRTSTVLGINIRHAFNLQCCCEFFFWIRYVACIQFETINNSFFQCMLPVVLARTVRWVWDITKLLYISECTFVVTPKGRERRETKSQEVGVLLGTWVAGIVLGVTPLISGSYYFVKDVEFTMKPVYNTLMFWISVVASFSVLIYCSLRLDKEKKTMIRVGMPPNAIFPITDVYRLLKRIIAIDLSYYAVTIVTDLCFGLGLLHNPWVTCIAKLNSIIMLTYETFICASFNSPAKLTEGTLGETRTSSESREELLMESLNSDIMTTEM